MVCGPYHRGSISMPQPLYAGYGRPLDSLARCLLCLLDIKMNDLFFFHAEDVRYGFIFKAMGLPV